MIDKVLLKALMRRDRFTALRSAVPDEMFDPATISLLDWYQLYFNTHTEHEVLDPDALLTLIKLRANLDKNGIAVMGAIVAQLKEPVAADVINSTINQLEEISFSGKAGALLAAYNNGDEIDITFELARLAQQTRHRLDISAGAKWADGDILDYLKADADEAGLQWTTFPVLNETLKGLRGGHNLAVSAPTDKGKTSLLCRLAVDFATQAKEVYPDQPLLYLINEGQAEVLTPRIYQTAVKKTRADLMRMAVDGTLVPAYEDIVGRRDAIRLVNIHGMNVSQVARIIEAHKPYMVITDMTGRIRSNSNNGGMNDVVQLEEAWNCMRELASMMNFIHLGTTQVSGEGMDNLYPPLTAMQNSKVGIQTTLDLCLMMGALNNIECADLRGISTPKNKLARSGKKSQNMFECWFSPETNEWNTGTQS